MAAWRKPFLEGAVLTMRRLYRISPLSDVNHGEDLSERTRQHPEKRAAATPRAVGAIRMQHSLLEDVQMSFYGAQV